MNVWNLILSSPVMQVSIAVLIAVIGLFITAAVQHRLSKLMAILLSVLLLADVSAGAVDGTVRYLEKTARIQMAQPEKEALVALASGDAREAYDRAVDAVISQPGRPGAWLTAARAALFIGDLSVADHYYGQLQTLSAADLALWDMAGDADEINAWAQVSQLPKSEWRAAANELAEIVKNNVEAQTDSLPAIQEEIDNYSALLEAEALFLQAQGADGEKADLDTVDEQLEDLMEEPGAEEARDILIESLVWQQEWDDLLDWLSEDGARGLIDIAGLVVEGALPEGALADAFFEDSDADAARELADTLWNLRNSAGEYQANLYLALGRLYAQVLDDPENALDIIEQALDRELNQQAGDLAVIRQLNSLRLLLDTLSDAQANGLLTEWLGGALSDESGRPDQTASAEPTAESTEIPLSEELSGENVRSDLTPFFNICAPEMTEAGRVRFYVTLAEGSGGFPGGEPEASDFQFRTNVGFQRLLTVHSMTEVTQVERYTMLIIDIRPGMTGEQIDLAQEAALAYVRSMDNNEHVLVYKGGIPTNYMDAAFPAGTTQLFGNREMETYLFSSDKTQLEQFILAEYTGDLYDGSDVYDMVAWALNQMTAISTEGVSGEWESFPLTSATPRFGQAIVFTCGDADSQMGAGMRQSMDYIRGAAIAANAAIHIVGINPVGEAVDLSELAEAGRGSYIDPSADSLLAFYSYVRNRDVKVFLADCQAPEDLANNFFELWAQHTPTGVMAGFMRNPGRGIDLVGTLHYSDASLSTEDFHDYTGDGTDTEGPGGNPFDNGEDGTGQEGTDEETVGDTITDWPGLDSVQVYGLDRHAIARNDSGLLLVNLLGQGFDGLSPSDVRITFPGAGTIQSSYIDMADDTTIRFFLPVTMPSGMYSMRVTIGDRTFNFSDTLWIYDADNFTIITFGAWTITAESAEEAGGGDWLLSGVVINDYLHFTGNTQVSGDWLTAGSDALAVSPGGEAYIAFDPESDSFLVENFYLEEGEDMYLGYWDPFTLERSGGGVPFYAQQIGGAVGEALSLGVFDLPFDEGTLYPDRVEMPVGSINLDLPLQNYMLMSEELLPLTASAQATMSVDIDSVDLALTAGLESDEGLKFMSALTISQLEFEIDTAQERLAVDIGVKLCGDDGFTAHLALKGEALDEISVTIQHDVPVTTTPPSPIPITITEFGGGVENLSALFYGDVADRLGFTLIGIAELEAGNAADLLPFLSTLSWLDEDDIPPVLATEDTSLKLTPWPFSIAFSTDLSLFGEFPVGHAELSIGYYAFDQALLGISDDEAIGLHALLEVGPDLDFSILRLYYRAGPSVDINQHGFFLAMNGTAGFGINLGLLEFTADLDGTFLVAVHGIPDSDWPQLSIVANAAPSVGIPGLWSAGVTKDVRLLINENGFCIVGIPSPLDAALEWLSDQIDDAQQVAWETVTAGMNAAEALGDLTWEIVDDGVDLAGEGLETVIDALTDGAGILLDTGDEVIDSLGNMAEEGVDYLAEGWSAGESTVEDFLDNPENILPWNW